MFFAVCRWCRRKLWLFMIFWWLLLLSMLITRVPNERVSNRLSDQMRENYILPEDANEHCPKRITSHLQSLHFKACSGLPDCEPLGIYTCNDVISGKAADIVPNNHDFATTSDEEIARIASKCDDLFAYGKYETSSSAGTELEMNFPRAYSILVQRDAGQVELLLRAIYQPNNAYCFHIDEQASSVFKSAMRNIVRCFPNVEESSRAVRVVPAGFSRLYADVLCMKDLVKSKHHWKYVINLAGTSLPLKTNWEIVNILSLYNGRNDIEIHPLNRTVHKWFSHKWSVLNHTNHTSSKFNSKLQYLVRTNITKLPPPHNLKIVRGSAYGAFSRAFVDFVFENKMAQDLLTWSMDTYKPTEYYWSTLQSVYHNPQLRTPGGFVGPQESTTGLSVYSSRSTREQCSESTSRKPPCVFGSRDFPQLIQRPEFFANEFSVEFEPIAQVCLSAFIQQRTKCQTEFDMTFYKGISFVMNRNLTIRRKVEIST